MGDMDTNPDSTPEVLAELQNIGVISVVIGDYHFGALTEAGKLLTWGELPCAILVPVALTPAAKANTLMELWDLVTQSISTPASLVAS